MGRVEGEFNGAGKTTLFTGLVKAKTGIPLREDSLRHHKLLPEHQEKWIQSRRSDSRRKGKNPMGLSKLISIAVTATFWAASTGQLPRMIRTVQIAQLKLIKDSQASRWPKAMTLPSR